MAVNDFDFVAPFYDRLSKLFFGKSLIKAQAYHLKVIGDKDRVLILGGGTGKLLEYIPKSGELDFVEKSVRMLDRAKRRKFHGSINFIQADFLEFDTDKGYDVIICPFFLDCFDSTNLRRVIAKCKNLLKPSGRLIVADFNHDVSNRLILKLMHMFFALVSNLESSKLQNIHAEIISSGFDLSKEKFLNQNQLFSRLYRNL